MHGVKDEIDAFPARQLGCGHEVSIASNQHDLIDLFLECQCGDIDTNPHVYAFLASFDLHICFGQIGQLDCSFEQLINPVGLNCPAHVGRQVPEA